MKKAPVIHPFLFAIFPALFFYSHNVEQMSAYAGQAVIAMAITAGIAALLLIVLSVVLRDWKKAGLIISVFLVFFFSYGHLFSLIEDFHFSIGGFTVGPNAILLSILSVLFIAGTYFFIRTHRNLRNLTNFLNIIGATIVVISLVSIVSYEFGKPSVISGDTNASVVGSKAMDKQMPDQPPDIYYLILDSYASSSVLEEYYRYDNNEFIEYLTQKGFYVASKSRANYAWTQLSLASSLNMKYINDLGDRVGMESKDPSVPYEMIQNSEVMEFLKSRGYSFINFSSGWGPTNSIPNADLNIRYGKFNEFWRSLVETTPLLPVMKLFTDYDFMEQDARVRVLETFSGLSEIREVDGPKFVFAHIQSPHRPFVFGANGERVPEAKRSMTSDSSVLEELYLNQLLFVNTQVEPLIESLLSKSTVPPVIILQADHGPGFSEWGEWQDPSEDHLIQRMRILNAYYLPPNGDDLLYDSISPVNTFRLVFDSYFGENYDLLTDESYYSDGASVNARPYVFTDVTDIVDYN